ncbi:MAG: hypothetical protein ABI639_01615 [Thermoanaerobaculia bacterium]
MRAYVITSGILFGVVTIAHLARMVSERHDLATAPWYLAITATTAAMSLWALRALRKP